MSGKPIENSPTTLMMELQVKPEHLKNVHKYEQEIKRAASAELYALLASSSQQDRDLMKNPLQTAERLKTLCPITPLTDPPTNGTCDQVLEPERALRLIASAMAKTQMQSDYFTHMSAYQAKHGSMRCYREDEFINHISVEEYEAKARAEVNGLALR